MDNANDNKPLAADLLKGAEEIAAFTGFDARSVYHFASKGRLPHFRVGALICARKSTLMRWIDEQEAAGRVVAA